MPGTPVVDLTAPSRPAVPPPDAAVPPAPPPPTAAVRVPAADTLEAMSPILRERLAVLTLAPSPQAYLDAAAAYRLYAVHDRAFDLIQEGMAAFPHDATLHAATAEAWRDWGLPARGLRDAHLAVRYAPDSAAAHTTLGTVLWVLGAERAALQAFERAAALAPDADYARYNRCVAARALRAALPSGCPPLNPGPEHR